MFEILDLCTSEMQVVVAFVKTIFTLIQIAIPGVLIVLGTIDMFKAMASGDEKKTKESQQKFIRRLIYAVVAFLIPFIIRLVFNFVSNNINTGDTTASSAYEEFFSCWNKKGGSSSGGSAGSSTCTCAHDGKIESGIDSEQCEKGKSAGGLGGICR
ncbi:MAG: hypothetical protein IKN09_03000 [Clostridia bacterium]|nr:hypothetical protein [Clostridia bacterium]